MEICWNVLFWKNFYKKWKIYPLGDFSAFLVLRNWRKFSNFQVFIFWPQMVRNMLKCALLKDFCEKSKMKNLSLRGLFWDLQIFGKISNFWFLASNGRKYVKTCFSERIIAKMASNVRKYFEMCSTERILRKKLKMKKFSLRT